MKYEYIIYNTLIKIIISSSNWNILIPKIKYFLDIIFKQIFIKTSCCKKTCNIKYVSIHLSNNNSLKYLNYYFKNKNMSTNTLCFSFYLSKLNKINLKKIFLGEIIINYKNLILESLFLKINFINYLSYIIMHSILHLYKYNHINTIDIITMQKIEKILLCMIN